jgi:hypothetical protein
MCAFSVTRSPGSVLGARCPALGANPLPGIRYQAPGSWYPTPGTRYLAPYGKARPDLSRPCSCCSRSSVMPCGRIPCGPPNSLNKYSSGIPAMDALILASLVSAGCAVVYTRDPDLERFRSRRVRIINLERYGE